MTSDPSEPSPSSPEPAVPARPAVIVVVAASTGTTEPAIATAAASSASSDVPVTDSSASDPVPASASVPASPPTPEWVPPDTLNEKLSRWSRTAVKTAVTLLGLLILTTFVLWLVPAVVMARSDEYRIATEYVKTNQMLLEGLGVPIETPWTPSRYRVHGPGDVELTFEIRGGSGWVERVTIRVRGGQIVEGPHRSLPDDLPN